MLPPVLAASELVEWAQLDAPTLARAIVAWHVLDTPGDDGDSENAGPLVTTLLDWWSIYTSSSLRWTVALAALDEMTRVHSVDCDFSQLFDRGLNRCGRFAIGTRMA